MGKLSTWQNLSGKSDSDTEYSIPNMNGETDQIYFK